VARRFALTAAASALLFTLPAGAQPKLLMPGVTYETRVEFTFHGPAVMHVLTVPRPGGLWTLEPALSNDAILGLERLTAIEKRLAQSATVAGVNGDRFAANGSPSGILLRDGVLDHGPSSARSSIGFDSTGTLRLDRIRLLPSWQGTGQRQTLSALNSSPSSSGTSLYTPAWGPATPVAPGAVELVLRPFPAASPNVEVSGPVAEVREGGGSAIPRDGAVLVARGAAAVNRVHAEAPLGTRVHVRLILQPDWAGVNDAVGGGPVLVRSRKALFNAKEAFVPSQLALPEPRTAVGQLADGRLILVVVDGKRPGYSSGMTNFELALALLRLGAVNAAALDSGASSTMAFDGELLNRPSGTERAVSNALLVSYAGVQAPLPAASVVSPNGDGVSDSQTLAFKVVRTSSVTASLIAPDGSSRTLASGTFAPGTYPYAWNGKTNEGLPELEGQWRWAVSCTDDLGRTSSFERPFALNTTLGFATTVGAALAVPRRQARAVAQFTLARPAAVTTRIETLSRTIVRKAGPAVSLPAGPAQALWDGRTDSGAAVRTGTYVARMSARNEAGTVSLTAKFAVRRIHAGKGSG
jgi:hypothetical protein